MKSTPALFGAGIALGAVAMYVVGGGGESPSAVNPAVTQDASPLQRPDAAAPAPSSIELLTLATASVGLAERAALFKLAAEADARTIESLAAQVAALPLLEGRSVALEALLTRYAELDAPAAAAFARKLGLPPAVLKPLYTTWARKNAREALRALGELDARPALPLGVAILDALGNDELGIARVLGAAPQLDADRFRIEAAIAKAAVDPAAALDDILALPPSKASTAFERLAVIWIERDVLGALAAADAIADDGQRNELKASLINVWARLDPDALVDYVLDLDADSRNEALRSGALQAFALVDAQRALQAAEGVPGELGAMMKRAALMSLARDDPLAALGIAEAMPSGTEREQMLSIIATSYGRTNPEAALAWAQNLNPPSPNVVANVLAGLARVDPNRAIDLLFESVDATNQRGAGPFMAMLANGALDSEQTARLADRLLAAPNRAQELQMMTRMWAQREPHDAVRWLLANSAAAPAAALGQAAMQLARRDPAAALAYAGEVPPDLRATWISSVADGYAQNDSRAATIWIAQHRGQPGYDAAVAAIASRTAASDPAAAARLLDTVNTAEAPDAPRASQRIANAWARQDPRAAASWAAAIGDADTRTAAVGEVAAQWAARDVPGARNWALGLPAGAARDRALTQLLGTSTGTPDAVVIDAFSNSEAQQSGVGDAVRMIALRDPAAARRLADQYLTDPAARRVAERYIEQGRAGGPALGPAPPRLPPGR